MVKVELAVYSDASNQAVVQTPGRRFPGSVIQGDSLSILCADARQLSQWIEANSDANDDVRWLAQGLQEALLSRLLHYQSTLKESGIDLPYMRIAAPSDLVVLVEQDAASDQ
ncbi:DUF6959 family protein [Variovorax paradoxus]|uniref:DUF6959 family protein n=1 Tax=Variovorax paradoxus TaxID=34073 RepID=UPI0012D4A5A7|nr:hypothetical protein [Variovorax paradoxus]